MCVGTWGLYLQKWKCRDTSQYRFLALAVIPSASFLGRKCTPLFVFLFFSAALPNNHPQSFCVSGTSVFRVVISVPHTPRVRYSSLFPNGSYSGCPWPFVPCLTLAPVCVTLCAAPRLLRCGGLRVQGYLGFRSDAPLTWMPGGRTGEARHRNRFLNTPTPSLNIGVLAVVSIPQRIPIQQFPGSGNLSLRWCSPIVFVVYFQLVVWWMYLPQPPAWQLQSIMSGIFGRIPGNDLGLCSWDGNSRIPGSLGWRRISPDKGLYTT